MLLFKKCKLKKVAKKNAINFNGHMGLSINGKIVSEFGYLLRYYTDGELDSFIDRSKIYAVKDQVIKSIDEDFLNEKTREEKNLRVSRTTAEANMRNLKFIIIALSNYYEAEIV